MEISRTVTIENKLGLHARAATKLAQLAQGFEATVTIQQADKKANADSVMALLMLASNQGKDVTVIATGNEAKVAVDAICELISNKFDEDE
ncbi:HPr family phosphocarrier protein [Psychrosphaera sp. B3R10]|uniref:HPr family phosphocarrier protein n=1 Tax=Psychrosphaera algicola TaxID=3023714 RepID=A0ABT5FG09_9GAMM|nr:MULTISPECIES: HPr family phosphocarrier protein [unclassified Psychrosphaera]MBU2881918.1 HPr family phosphocarrier protein [Psychrosphaera sp. I2R16]MBU2991229.1 HPr family phosphocarrier protein [Psychrosphaera sp. B3R10]MDC2890489.1 HPr family phosphocarrier protein [Psychrosphaera sp. G1-22]MDO6721005.1 HPr family phosphocarrier protein [Psychrosphaera sp. 1_MG-2023]